MDHPTFVRIDYWDPQSADWTVGHGGINLMNPAKYVHSLKSRGVIARAVDIDTGDMVYGEGADLL